MPVVFILFGGVDAVEAHGEHWSGSECYSPSAGMEYEFSAGSYTVFEKVFVFFMSIEQCVV